VGQGAGERQERRRDVVDVIAHGSAGQDLRIRRPYAEVDARIFFQPVDHGINDVASMRGSSSEQDGSACAAWLEERHQDPATVPDLRRRGGAARIRDVPLSAWT